MSSISSRPRVQKIAGPVLTSVAATGAVLAAKALAGLLRPLVSTVVHHDAADVTSNRALDKDGLQAVAALRDAFLKQQQDSFVNGKVTLPPAEAFRVATLSSLTSTSFFVGNPTALAPHITALQQADTLSGVQRAGTNLLNALEYGHQQVFTETLAIACRRAAEKLGFVQADLLRLPEQVRIIATDAKGRTLVTEIGRDTRKGTSIATEVVGVSDGSCQQLLDRFDKALEEEGVHSTPPERKETGGVCELATAREFVRRKLKPGARGGQQDPTRADSAARRTQTLNRETGPTTKAKG
jgi:hypothetical protein